MPQRTTWEIYEIQHCRGPGYPVRERYQFVDGHGRRRHFSTKARAKLERDRAKALFTREGKLAAGMDEQQRRDAVQAVNFLPVGWTLTRCVQFVADHVKRTTQVLSIEEALDPIFRPKLYQSSRGPFQSVRLRFQNRSDAGEPTFDHRETSDQASQARDLE